jgi:hypothetical protein
MPKGHNTKQTLDTCINNICCPYCTYTCAVRDKAEKYAVRILRLHLEKTHNVTNTKINIQTIEAVRTADETKQHFTKRMKEEMLRKGKVSDCL